MQQMANNRSQYMQRFERTISEEKQVSIEISIQILVTGRR